MYQGRTVVVLAMQRGINALLHLEKPETTAECDDVALCLTHVFAWEYANMNKKAARSENGAVAQWTRFVEIPLAPYVKADVDERYVLWDDFASDVCNLLSSGHRLAVSFNEGNRCFIASITCRVAGSPNEGCTFTAFAGDWYRAVAVALFKFYVVAPGEWAAQAQANGADAVG